jgi:hypothetical protein
MHKCYDTCPVPDDKDETTINDRVDWNKTCEFYFWLLISMLQCRVSLEINIL